MTDLQILAAVKNNGGSIEYTDLLNQNMTDTNRDGLADEARIKQMIEDGLLKGKTEAYCHISITKPGRLRLQDFYYLEDQEKNLADEASKNKSNEHRHDLVVALIGAIVGSLSGIVLDVVILLLEHF